MTDDRNEAALLERVARAIGKADGFSDDDWELFVAEARAAIDEITRAQSEAVQALVDAEQHLPRLLTETEQRSLLSEAEALWHDLQSNQLGGFSGINRPFYIIHEFKRVIEKYGGRDVGLTWSKDRLDAAQQEGSSDE